MAALGKDMFEEMDRHKYLDVLEIGETEDWEHRIVIAEAGAIENSEPLTPEEEPDASIRELLSGCRPIEVTASSSIYEVRFEDYVTYSIRNESFVSADPGEVYEGQLARIYSKSAFLDYVANSTFATSDYPGPFKHYGFCCLNHIVDVAALVPPTVTRMNA